TTQTDTSTGGVTARPATGGATALPATGAGPMGGSGLPALPLLAVLASLMGAVALSLNRQR
ncbi:MAG: hypothetical protein ACR2OO_05235, partial [Thermomicrobiales bacterium]